jgi:hypothetical protein
MVSDGERRVIATVAHTAVLAQRELARVLVREIDQMNADGTTPEQKVERLRSLYRQLKELSERYVDERICDGDVE